MKLRILIWGLLLLVACTSIKYQDDFGFLVSAQANSPEYPVKINDKICKDADGIPGLCAKRIKSDSDINIAIEALPYSYRINIQCSAAVGIDESVDVEANKPLTYTISKDKFSALRSFTCIGEILPSDRDQAISAKWEVRIIVVDADYVSRESMYITKEKGKYYLVAGANARTTIVYDHGKRSVYDKKTIINVSNDKDIVALSESYNMRYNTFGL